MGVEGCQVMGAARERVRDPLESPEGVGDDLDVDPVWWCLTEYRLGWLAQ